MKNKRRHYTGYADIILFHLRSWQVDVQVSRPSLAGAPVKRGNKQQQPAERFCAPSIAFSGPPWTGPRLWGDLAMGGTTCIHSRRFSSPYCLLPSPYVSGLGFQPPFPPTAFCGAVLVGTMTPSDFRCAMIPLALGLLASPCHDDGCADGSLVFRDDPCTRAAPRTPLGSTSCSRALVVDVALPVT